MDAIEQEKGQQNNLPPVESNLYCNMQPATEQTVDIPRSDTNGKYGINSEKNYISPIVQLPSVNQRESCIKPTCVQSLAALFNAGLDNLCTDDRIVSSENEMYACMYARYL